MFLKRIIVCGIVLSMVSLSAAPPKKISTTRVGQLEAEYRTATLTRKDQIIQELTSGGFSRIAQQLIERYAPVKKQEVVPQKPAQASTVVQSTQQSNVQAALEKPVEQTEQQRIAQAKEHAEKIKQYTMQFQQLENAIKSILSSVKSMQDFDALSKQIDDLAALKERLKTEVGDIQALRDALENNKQTFVQKQKQKHAEVGASISKVVNAVKSIKDLDQVKKVRDDINAERLKVGLYALEQTDKDAFLVQLGGAENSLHEIENKLLKQQTEQEQKERAERERIAQEKAAQQAALNAEQEKKQKEHDEQERQKKSASLKSAIETAVKDAQNAQEANALEHMSIITDTIKQVEDTAFLNAAEKKELAEKLRSVLGQLRKKDENFQKQKSVQAQTLPKTITVPSFAGGHQVYQDVTITTNTAGNVTNVLYKGKPIEQLGNQAQRNNVKWIGAEIQVSNLVEQFSTMKTGAFRVKVPSQGVITSIQAWQTGVENGLQGQQGSEANNYFNDYLKPALAEKTRRLAAQ